MIENQGPEPGPAGPDPSLAPGPEVESDAEESTAESSSKGMLRDAIQKVMGEIQHHEREARRHLQQARELRRDLRESFAFLVEQEGSVRRPSAAEEPAPAAEEPPSPDATTSDTTAAPRRRGRRKKRRVGRRAKEG